MTKDFKRIADIVETNAINGRYKQNRRSRRSGIPTNFFINESSKEHNPKKKKNKKKKKKKREEDEEDEDEERVMRRRKPSSKRRILEDSDEDDDDIDTDEKETIRDRKRRLTKNHRENKLVKSFVVDDEDLLEVQRPISICQSVTPINEGGNTFSLINELSHNTDDENEGLRATRELVDSNYQKAQQLKNEKAFDALQSLRQNDVFDDEASSEDDEEEGKKRNVISVVGNNNNITINNVINQQQQHQPRYQQHLYQQQQQHYWSPSMKPSQLQCNHLSRYEQPQYYAMNQDATYQTPVRTRQREDNIRLEILRIRNSGYCSKKQIEWLKKYEGVLSRKLQMFISGQQLSQSDNNWIRNEKRNRCGSRTPWQLDLLTRLIELRIN
ncbi:hypothetical protein ACHAWC_011860 [Mediolabrus comicus]